MAIKKIYQTNVTSIHGSFYRKELLTARKGIGTLTVLLFAIICGSAPLKSSTASAGNPAAWRLVWSDEFSGPYGSAVDSTKWSFDLGGKGWGNNELETYTSRPANAHRQDGSRVINAIKETFTGADKISRNYTSARVLTKHKFSQTYGRVEARIKIPFGQGIWPAFWMLGDNIDSVHWGNCG